MLVLCVISPGLTLCCSARLSNKIKWYISLYFMSDISSWQKESASCNHFKQLEFFSDYEFRDKDCHFKRVWDLLGTRSRKRKGIYTPSCIGLPCLEPSWCYLGQGHWVGGWLGSLRGKRGELCKAFLFCRLMRWESWLGHCRASWPFTVLMHP